MLPRSASRSRFFLFSLWLTGQTTRSNLWFALTAMSKGAPPGKATRAGQVVVAEAAKSTLSIFPHAEEVELRRGSAVGIISSTTGRMNRAAPDSASGTSAESEETIKHDSGPAAASASPAGASPSTNAISNQVASAVSAQRRAAAAKPLPYRCYDVFGFCVTEAEKAAEDYERRNGDYSTSYLDKWQRMTARWGSVSTDKLKRNCRRGVPQARRRVVWQRLLRSWGMKERNPGVYVRLRSQPLESETIEGVIERDLDRTFPTHRLFEGGADGQGQRMLRSILRAYANYNAAVGYCQGMSFLAATLILQIEEEEDAFWAFVALMENERYNMKAVFAPGFPQLQCIFHVFEALMRKRMPGLHAHLCTTHQISPSFYAVHWFMTVFTYYFNFGLVSRIWDMFLCEGWKPVYRIALALLKVEERRLLSLKTETELLLALKAIQESKNPAELLKVALDIKFKSAYVNKLVAEYNSSPK